MLVLTLLVLTVWHPQIPCAVTCHVANQEPASALAGVSRTAPSLLPKAGVEDSSTTAPPAVFDEQLGETFAQNTGSLSYNVTAVAQTDSYGYGPAYLLNGLSNTGYWYQVGVSYDWPYQGGGYDPGFHMNYEVFAPNGSSVFPVDQGGVASFNGPVASGDQILVSIRFTLGNVASSGLTTGNSVTMSAEDLRTGAQASVNYSSMGATYFVGSAESRSNSAGFFTGLMTEWYHVNKYYGNEAEAVYSTDSSSLSSAWLWIDEFNSTSPPTVVFIASTPGPVVFQPPGQLQAFSSHGATEYSNSTQFLTGEIGFTIVHQLLPNVTTDYGFTARANVSVAVAGGSAPYTYKVYFRKQEVYSGVMVGDSLNSTFTLGAPPPGVYGYYISVSDSSGETLRTLNSTVKVNSDPVFTVNLSKTVYDAGEKPMFTYNVSGGTPPFTIRLLTASGKPLAGNLTTSVTGLVFELVDAAGYSVNTTPFKVMVNPDPTATYTHAPAYADAGEKYTVSVEAENGTPPYTYLWFVNGSPTSLTASSVTFSVNQSNATQPHPFTFYVKVTDSAGYSLTTQTVTVYVNKPMVVSSFNVDTSSNFIFTNSQGVAKVDVSLGTPPYTYTWYLNGDAVANTTLPRYTYHFSKGGVNTVQVEVTDSASQVTYSQSLEVNYSYNYPHIVLLTVVAALALAAAAYAAARRR